MRCGECDQPRCVCVDDDFYFDDTAWLRNLADALQEGAGHVEVVSTRLVMRLANPNQIGFLAERREVFRLHFFRLLLWSEVTERHRRASPR